MKATIKLLDCTLRDGAYITNADFGEPTLRGVIKHLRRTHMDIIECGWLKNGEYKSGTSFFHKPEDAKEYLGEKDSQILYCAMIDWDRYDISNLSEYDGGSIDAVRVVFPHGKYKEGIAVGEEIRKKGYQVLFQVANTLAYTDEELVELAKDMNMFMPLSVSIVDTFGAMLFDDLTRIADILDRELDPKIEIGFHAHNNQQLAFALSIHFVDTYAGKRSIIIDSTLSGIGRGAGNATTELMTGYLNRKHFGNYDMNEVLDAIDIYVDPLRAKYTWGYSTPYFIAGMYQCHVNNIAYLLNGHRTKAKDMRSVIESLSSEERRRYDYDLLEQRYIENQNRIVDDTETTDLLSATLYGKAVLILAPGSSIQREAESIKKFIAENQPVVLGVNAVNENYSYDYMFFTKYARYSYAHMQSSSWNEYKKILLSNVKVEGKEGELIFNYNMTIKRGYEHFDNAVILCLRLLNRLNVHEVYIAGFDGFHTTYEENYFDPTMPMIYQNVEWEKLNTEIASMFGEVRRSLEGHMTIRFLTDSIYDREG